MKEEQCAKLHAGLDTYKKKFSLVRHKQSLLYADFVREQQAIEEERKRTKERLDDTEAKRAELQVHAEELAVRSRFHTFALLHAGADCASCVLVGAQRLQETLRQSPDEQQARLAELTRKVTLLRVNEQNLVRKYQAMVDSEAFFRRVRSS